MLSSTLDFSWTATTLAIWLLSLLFPSVLIQIFSRDLKEILRKFTALLETYERCDPLSKKSFVFNSFESFGFLTTTTAGWSKTKKILDCTGHEFSIDLVFSSCLFSSANLGESPFFFFFFEYKPQTHVTPYNSNKVKILYNFSFNKYPLNIKNIGQFV